MRKRITEETLYQFDELSERAQDKAIEKLWDLNVDDSYWFEWIDDDIERFGEASGLHCTYGRGFDLDRGQYIHIENISCTLSDLQAHYQQCLAEYPDVTKEVIEPLFANLTPRDLRHLNRLETLGYLRELSGETSTNRRGRRFDIDTDVWTSHKRLYSLIQKLEQYWDDLLRDLEHYYVHALTAEYEYKTSREAIVESIQANEYEFLEDGTLA